MKSDLEDDKTARLLRTVVDEFDKEDESIRERQVRQWRRLKLYWNNLSQHYWSDSSRDYKIFDGTESGDQGYYDKPVNVFKAFLETIIAALSIQVPVISCSPDDADNPLDISTAKAGDKIATLIYKHNNVVFLWLHALYIYCTEGLIACYSYSHKDKAYGTYKVKKFEDEIVEAFVCPICTERVPDEAFSNAQLTKLQPNKDDIELNEIINELGPVCPQCGEMIDINLQKTKLIIPKLTGETDEPKSRVVLEVYGGLYVRISNSAKKQEDTPFLNFIHETHYVNPLHRYPKLRDELPEGGWSNIGMNDPHEQYSRLNVQYRGEIPDNHVTVSTWWLRPAAFNTIHDEADYKYIKKKFPNGAKIVFVNEICAEYVNENLDDYWTLTRNPLSDFLTHEPLGELLTNIQDIINDLISLTLQTIEHGIAQTWADPSVVDFQAFSQLEATPGTLTPTKPVAGSKNIGEAFFVSKQASLSPEIFNFYRIVQELGQFVSGALPSLFGGTMGKGTSQTASEYAMSRSGAQQRLQTPWKMLSIWWKTIFTKVIPMYMKNISESQDEKTVEKDKQGKYINIFIRKSEIEGKIGSIELENNEKMPLTDEEQGDVVMKLMELNNAEVQQALMDPENLPYIRKIIRIPQFRIPGEDDRTKQYEEIVELVNGEPIILPPDETQMMEAAMMAQEAMQTGMPPPPPPEPQELPSVEVDETVDNHEVEATICRGWLVSEAGRLAKKENPAGYKNVLLHMKAHMDILVQREMARAQSMAPPPGEEQPGNGQAPAKKPSRPETVEKSQDVRTPIQ